MSSGRRRRGRTSKSSLNSKGELIPGGGTTSDITHLSRTLGMTEEAVEAMMAAQGAGTTATRNTRRSGGPPVLALGSNASETAAASSNAWADFIKDEMSSDPNNGGKREGNSAPQSADPSTSTSKADTTATPTNSASPTVKKSSSSHTTATPATSVTPTDKTPPKLTSTTTTKSNPSGTTSSSKKLSKKSNLSSNKSKKYNLPLKPQPLVNSCLLAQSGTLDSTIVGRHAMNLKVRQYPSIDLCEPTLLFPKSIFSKIRIGSIAASASSCHVLAIDMNGGLWGWGRNEDGQLGIGSAPNTTSTSNNSTSNTASNASTNTNASSSSLSDYFGAFCIPRKVSIPGKEKIQTAAVGKHHSVVITKTGGVLACGKNNVGQLGINSSIDCCHNFRKSTIVLTGNANKKHAQAGKKDTAKKRRGQKKSGDEGTVVVGTVTTADGNDIKFVQAACGENFSVILSNTGIMYTTGSSEYGQLGNGATGEYFISASKIGFANCHRFEPRTHFVTSEETNFSTGTNDKKVTLIEDIRISHISCGKNHSVAVEAAREGYGGAVVGTGSDISPGGDAVGGMSNTGDNDGGSNRYRRIFSWGCGDYGCLGHGVQVDEYYPRQLTFFRSKMFHFNPPISGACGAQCSTILTEKGHGYNVGRHRYVGDAVMRPTLCDALASNGHIVTSMSAGSQTIICCTKSGVTVTWGNGLYGDLGYGESTRSSSKPKFVPVMDSCIVTRLASGCGSTIFLIRDEDSEDKEALKKLKSVEKEDVHDFEMDTLFKYREKKGSRENGFGDEEEEKKTSKRKQVDGKKKGPKKPRK